MVAMSMNQSAAPVSLGPYLLTADEPVVIEGLGWSGYETLLAMRGEKRRPRMIFFDGAVELMALSKRHERVRFVCGRLLEIYMLELGVPFSGYGQTTYKASHASAGFEADECYVLGEQRDDRPDLVLEVVCTNGGRGKLGVYKAFGVPEVWIWESGALQVYALGGGQYEAVARSRLLPGVDLELLARFIERAEELDSETMRAFRDAVRARGSVLDAEP